MVVGLGGKRRKKKEADVGPIGMEEERKKRKKRRKGGDGSGCGSGEK